MAEMVPLARSAVLLLAGLELRLAGVGAVALALFAGSAIKYADQWEKAVVLRLGRYRGLRGPGFFVVIPILDRVSYHIDQRIRTTAFGAESCLTRDTVPVDVDAIAFWVVSDAERAALAVQEYEHAVIVARAYSAWPGRPAWPGKRRNGRRTPRRKRCRQEPLSRPWKSGRSCPADEPRAAPPPAWAHPPESVPSAGGGVG